MIEALVLGAVQGIAEWLPVSSEAMVVLVKNNVFPDGAGLSEHIRLAIFLHLGTLLAALVYFWPQVKQYLHAALNYRMQFVDMKLQLRFIALASVVSGVIGFALIYLVEHYESFFADQGAINLFVAIFLCITALLLYFSERANKQGRMRPTNKDAVITGVFQGCAAIPGISRSGSTIAGMGLLGFDKLWALEMSFILSIPLVFFANIVFNYQELLNPDLYSIVAVITAFIFGYYTISALLKIVKRVRFSYFVGLFALILIATTLVV
jgi:undecaprenyl-diphosphatase